MTTRSHWRLSARVVIEAALAALPASADDAVKRRAVSQAYPFGERRHHPYRAWRQEVEAILGKRRQPATPEVRVDANGEEGPCIVCDWCRGKDCLSCLKMRQKLERIRAVTNWTEWRRWLHLLGEAPLAERPLLRLAFADWLEESGWPEEAARMRKEKP